MFAEDVLQSFLSPRYFVMGLHPPELQFTISVVLEQRVYLTTNGSGVWKKVSKLDIGPRQRIALSDSHQVTLRDSYLVLR